jgi:hypothetical protein
MERRVRFAEPGLPVRRIRPAYGRPKSELVLELVVAPLPPVV